MSKQDHDIIIFCESCGRVLYRGGLIGREKFRELTRDKCRYCGRVLNEDWRIKGIKNNQSNLEQFGENTK